MQTGTMRKNGASGKGAISRDTALEKMGRLASVMGWVCRIAGTIALAVTALSMGTVLSIALGAVNAGATVRMGGGGIALTTPAGGTSVALLDGGRNAIGVFLGMLLCVSALLVAGRFFSAVAATRRPFTTERACDLRRIGILLMVAGLGSRLAGMVATLAVFAAFGYDGSWSFAELFDPAALAAGVCVLVFARIFEYGCVLQEQDDGLV